MVPSCSCSSSTFPACAISRHARTTSASQSREEDATPPDQLDMILRDGPPWAFTDHLVRHVEQSQSLLTHQQLASLRCAFSSR